MYKYEPALRLKQLPPYLFSEIDRMKREAMACGKTLLNLGVGDPDMPTPSPVIEKLKQEAELPVHHQYPPYEGTEEFRKAVLRRYKKLYGVELGLENVIALIGSKEGIANLTMAFANPGDVVLTPDPGYPVYYNSAIFAGATPIRLPLKEESYFLPDLSAISPEIAEKTKILFLCYPNNPTGAIAPRSFLEEAIAKAIKYRWILAYDNAYGELVYDGLKPTSIFQIKDAIHCAIEFNSLSKPYNMTGWRIGYAVGAPSIIEGLLKFKTNVDSGQFTAIQQAGIEALEKCDPEIEKIRETYRIRRDMLITAMNSAGWKVSPPRGAFYIWAKIPSGENSMDFVKSLLEETGIVATPGTGFGPGGEGYVRFSLTAPTSVIEEASRRLSDFLKKRLSMNKAS